MSRLKRIKRSSTEHHDEEVVAPTATTDAEHLAEEKAKTEAMLDDIDALLEEQELHTEIEAAEFVRGYVQKGGE